MKIEKPVEESYPVEALLREFHAELDRVLAAHPRQHFTADLFDVLRTALYVMVSVPAYLVAGVAMAAATYVRFAGMLFSAAE